MTVLHATDPPTPLRPRRLTPGFASRLVESRRERLPHAVVRGSLDDGLKVCLALLASEPDRFEPAAVAWHRRWCAELSGIGFAESRAALAALEGLIGPHPTAAGRALRAVCLRHGLDEVVTVLDAWLQRRAWPVDGGPTQDAPWGPAAA